MSSVWKFFTRLSKDRATCIECKKEYACTNGTTSSLINHLQKAHLEAYKQYKDQASVKTAPVKRPAEEEAPWTGVKMKSRKIEDCIQENDKKFNEVINDMLVDFLADSGVAFRVIGLKTFKDLMKKANRRINLKSPRTYSRLVKVKANQIRKELLSIVAAVKGDMSCAGFTTDMWTSGSGDPFMSLTIHMIDKEWRLHR